MKAPKGYSRAQVLLHWAVVILVALQIAFHEGMAVNWERALETGSFTLTTPVILHFVVGTAILGLAAWRLLIRMERGVPGPPEGERPAFQMLARAVHLAFYGVLVLLPVTGALAWGSQRAALGEVHEILRAILILLILLHIAGVLYHGVVLKSGILQRMTRPDI